MDRMLSEIRVPRIVDAVGRYCGGGLSSLEAAEVLGMSARHFRRLRDRCETGGAGDMGGCAMWMRLGGVADDSRDPVSLPASLPRHGPGR